MLLLREVLLAEAVATIGAAAKGFFAAFMTAVARSDCAGTPALLHIEGLFVLQITYIPQNRLISTKEGVRIYPFDDAIKRSARVYL